MKFQSMRRAHVVESLWCLFRCSTSRITDARRGSRLSGIMVTLRYLGGNRKLLDRIGKICKIHRIHLVNSVNPVILSTTQRRLRAKNSITIRSYASLCSPVADGRLNPLNGRSVLTSTFPEERKHFCSEAYDRIVIEFFARNLR